MERELELRSLENLFRDILWGFFLSAFMSRLAGLQCFCIRATINFSLQSHLSLQPSVCTTTSEAKTSPRHSNFFISYSPLSY